MAYCSVRNHLRLALLHTAGRIAMHLQNFHQSCCQSSLFGYVTVTKVRQSYTKKRHVWYATLNALHLNAARIFVQGNQNVQLP